MNEEVLQRVYQSAQQHFDMPPYEQFVVDMQDEEKLARFRESMLQHFDMPDMNTFKNDIGFGGESVEIVSTDVDEKKNLNVDLNQPNEINLPPEQTPLTPPASPSGLTGDDITSESYLTQRTFDTSDPFANTILSKEYGENLDDNVFQANIDFIDEKLTSDREEESVVPEMNYKFGQYGFKFEETGAGDKMKVTSANGEEMTVPLDAFGMPFFEGLEINAKKRANELKKFLQDNREASELAFAEGLKKEEFKLNKIQDEKELMALNTLFNTQVDRFAEDVKAYSAEKIRLEKIYKNSFAGKTPQELAADPNYNTYKMASDRLDMVQDALHKRQLSFQQKGREFDLMVGEFVDARYAATEAKGGLLGIERLLKSFLGGVGGAITSLPNELYSGIIAPIEYALNPVDVDEDFDSHVDFAIDLLSQNREQKYKVDDVNILGGEYADEVAQIKGILDKGTNLDAYDQERLKKLMLEIGSTNGKALFQSIENADGDDLRDYTVNAMNQVYRKSFQERGGDPTGFYATDILDTQKGEGGIRIGTGEIITGVDRAKSAARGDAFNRNPYTGQAGFIGRELESGSREAFNSIFTRYLGQEDTPQEFLRKAYKNKGNDFQKAMHGVTYSIPAFIGILKTGAKKTGELTMKYGPELGKKLIQNRKNINKTTRIVRLMAQSTDAQLQKMAMNPNFDNINEGEKRIIAYPVAIATAILEDYGFRNLLTQQGFVNGLVGRALLKTNKTTTSKTFAEFIRKDLKNLMRDQGKDAWKIAAAQGGLVLGAGAATEFETGALQTVAELSSEYIYNLAREKLLGKDAAFNTPQSVGAFFKEVAYQGYLEALGGKVMAVPTAISAMASNPNDLDLVSDEAFAWYQEMLKDPSYKKMFVTNLKQRVADPNDPLTQAGADGLLANYNQIEALMPSIPTDYTVQQSRVALNLLLEKQNLENKIDGKNKQLTKKDQDRIAEINEQLENITVIAAQQQEAAAKAEASIPELGTVATQTETEETDSDGDITIEEKQDIEEAFGSKEDQTGVTNNLFFNRKGKPKGALDKEQTSMRNKVINRAVKAAKSLAKNFKTKIVLHESSDEFNNATGRKGRGFYDFDTNTIHIDMNKAIETTVAHEAFHAMLFERLGEANIAKAVNMLTKGVMSAVDKNTMLYKKADAFAKQYKSQGMTVQNEERLAELFGIMSSNYQRLERPAQNAILNFLKSTARTLGIDKLIDISPNITQDDAAVVDLLNTLADKVAMGQEVFVNDFKVLEKSEPYSDNGVAATVNPKAKAEKVPGREQQVYKGENVSDLPTTTLNDFAAQHNGNIYVINSDATALDPEKDLLGGFGYAALKDNNENGVGFASENAGKALSNMNKLKNKYKAGDRVGVAIMIQTPDAMYGNMYGSEFLYDALEDLQRKDPAAYKKYSKEMASYSNSRMGGALSPEVQAIIIDPSSFSETEFTDAMKNESFDRRRYYMQGIIPSSPSLKTNKSTPAYKKALLDNGTNTQDFNLEYGDKALLGETVLKENKGGYVVGGFTYVVPEDTKSLVEETQDKGITHPFFVGKVPSEANSAVIFDGLYSVKESLQPFMPETLLKDKTKEVEINERVIEQYQDDKFYKPEVRNKPLSQRTYTDLKGENKVEFKYKNKDLMVVGQASATSLIAQSKPPLFEQITEKIIAKPRGREQQQEADGQVFTFGETNYDIDGAMNIVNTQETQSVKLPMDILPKMTYAFVTKTEEGIENADLSQPVIIATTKDGLLLIDGHHRVEKAIQENTPLTGKILDEAQTKKIILSPRGREQKDIVDIIVEGRTEYNFRDELIKDYLVRVKGYPASVVNKLMNIDVDLFNTLPKTFANIQGGMEAGVKLFKRVKAFEQKLIKGNKRRKVKLTEQQIADQTIEFLTQQPEYKNEGDGTKNLTTKQAMLQVEFQRAVGTRTSENVQEKLTAARRMVQQRKRGAKDLQKAKAAIRNFIRKSLPADIYTRSEVMSLIRKVTNANETNLENIFEEVLEFVNKKNNARLENKIENILNGKYETKVSGRKKGTKISLNIKERIEKIKQDRLGKNSTAKQIEAENEALTQEFNSIAAKSQTTEGDFSRMVDLQILINLNNSLLMENTDVNKTGSLDTALAALEEMIEIGRSELKQQLEDQHNKYNEDASIAYEEVTGEKTDLGDKGTRSEVDLKNQKRLNAKRNKLKGVLRKFTTKLNTMVTKFFNEAEALDGLMDLISTLPGEMFGGRLQEMVTGRVDASSRMFKRRMMEQEGIISKKFEELYGKKWRNKVRDNNKPAKEATYLLDPDAVAKAENDFNTNPSLENKQALEKALLENSVHLSQNEMMYYYNLYKDPANAGSFKATFGKDYVRIMEEIESKMEDEVKEFADWQVNEFYPSLYEHYNKTYKALYRTNLPWNRFYAGMIYRNDTQGNPIEQQPLDMLSDKSIMNTSVGASSTKSRTQNNLPIRKMNNMNVMATYLRDMEYFAAYGETIRDIYKMFTNKQVKDAIGAIHGDYVNRLIRDMIGKIANKGVRDNRADRFVNYMNNLFIFSRIGLNPTVMLKQLTSMITYANDIGFRNWLKYSLKNIPQIKKTFKEISENSVYMQDRNRQSITRVIESYTEDGMTEFVPNQYWDFYVNFIMYSTKFGDKAAIYLGGMPNYLYYKDQALKRGLSEEQAQKEAIIKFEKDTKRTQQSMDLQDRDYYQTAGALQRGLNMFLTTPKQYLRKEIQSTRNLWRKLKAWDRNAGKGTLGENLRTFITYHLLAPTLFQYVALGLPGLLRPVRPDDEEDLIRAMVIGNLNALFIVGDAVNQIADVIQQKPYAGKQGKSIAPLMSIARISQLATRALNTKDPEKRAANFAKLYIEIVNTTGLPATQVTRFVNNLEKMGKTGDIGTDILRLFNFSDYVIEGGQKKSTKKTKSIAEQNAEYYKEQERKKRQSNNLNNSDVFAPINQRNRTRTRRTRKNVFDPIQ